MSHIRSRKHPVSALSRPARATALATLIVPGALYAQQTLPTVNVRSTQETDYRTETSANPKVVRPLSETPQTISVIRKELLQDQQAMTVSDALRNTPGITMLMGENGNTATGDSIFMRGVDTQGSIFVDGMRDVGSYSRDLFNIEQVEVIKGPAGADIGRGSPSGYVNVVTKLPERDNFATGTLSVGSGVLARLTADMNRRLGGQDGTTAVRLNVMKQGGGVAGRDEVRNGAWGIAPSAAFGLGTPTRIYLYGHHLERDKRPDGGLPTVGLPGYYSAALGEIRPGKVDTANYYGARDDKDIIKVDMVTARLEHDLRPGLTLRNAFRYGKADQDLRLTGVFNASFPTPTDPATYTAALLRQGKIQRNEILTNQTSVSADFRTGALRHTLVGGVEFIYEKQNNLGMGIVGGGTQLPQNLYDPSLDLVFQPIGRTGASTRGQTTTIAGYASDTVDITDRIQVGAGLRLDKYRTEYTSFPATGAADPTVADLTKSGMLKTWKLSALYKLAPNGNVYLAYGHSERPPGSDNFTLNAGVPNATTGLVNINTPNLDPQKARNAELGTKWDVADKKLSLTAALFRTTLENDLARQDPVLATVTQFGERRVQGIELGAVGSITDYWKVMAGLARMDTKVTEGSSETQQGALINWSPKLTLTAWSTYHLPRTGLTVGGGVRHISMQKRQINNAVTATTSMPEIDGYTVFDAMAVYDINKNFALQLNLYNLTDKFYVASMNNAGNRYTLGTPRSVMLAATVRF